MKLREIIEYDPETGLFRWKANDRWRNVYRVPGTIDARGYRVIKINGKTYKCGRLAWYLSSGAWPQGEIDHINRDKQDNRLSNLRDVTRSENQTNIPARTPSKKKGIYWRKDCGKWIVLVRRNYKLTYLGLFPSIEEAEKAQTAYMESVT